MTVRALHMLQPQAEGSLIRETTCGRKSCGGGIGKQILSFAGESGGDFEATEYAPAVTCRKCLKAMARAQG